MRFVCTTELGYSKACSDEVILPVKTFCIHLLFFKRGYLVLEVSEHPNCRKKQPINTLILFGHFILFF